MCCFCNSSCIRAEPFHNPVCTRCHKCPQGFTQGSPGTAQKGAHGSFCFLQVYRDERKVQKLMQPRTLGNPNPAHGPGCQVGATSGTVSGAPRIERTSVSLVSADPVSNAPASVGPGMTCQAPRTSHCTFRSVGSGQPKPCLWPRVPGWSHKWQGVMAPMHGDNLVVSLLCRFHEQRLYQRGTCKGIPHGRLCHASSHSVSEV